MKLTHLALCIAVALITTVASAQTDTSFTYQGELQENGSPANGSFNIDFSLWDAVTGGSQIGTTDVHDSVPAIAGKFNVELDFGASAFDNSDRWLKVTVNGSQLSPRQAITRAPYAIQTRGIFVDNHQNVGIRTTEPAAHLDVHGLLRASQLIFDQGLGTWQSTLDRNGEDLETTHDAQGDIKFFPRPNSGGVVERLTIKPDGNVGIGTALPETRLHLSGSESIMQTITSSSGAGTWIELENTSTGGKRWGMLSTGANNSEGAGKLLLRSISDGRTVMTLQGDGNVGVGTAAPGFLLHVNGDAGKPGGGSWANASDIRLKKNIEPLDDALDMLLRLRGVSFEYIDPYAIHELPGQRIGMIAQEVEKVVPDWVDVGDNGYKNVTHRGFEALTLKALRELRAEKDADISTLREEKDAEISELKQQIEDLKRLMNRATSTNEEQTK